MQPAKGAIAVSGINSSEKITSTIIWSLPLRAGKELRKAATILGVIRALDSTSTTFLPLFERDYLTLIWLVAIGTEL